jgi:hypothetical protein
LGSFVSSFGKNALLEELRNLDFVLEIGNGLYTHFGVWDENA